MKLKERKSLKKKKKRSKLKEHRIIPFSLHLWRKLKKDKENKEVNQKEIKTKKKKK